MEKNYGLRVNYQNIKRHLELFIGCLVSSSDIHATVFELPKLTPDDVGKTVEHISVIPHEGEYALSLYCTHLLNHNIHSDQESGRLAKRLPGFIIAKTNNANELIERVCIINKLKSEFEKQILALSPDVDKRFEIVKSELPGLIKLSATRKLLMANKPKLHRIGFAWSTRKSMKKESRKEVLTRLDNSQTYGHQGSIDPSAWQEMVEREKRSVINSNDTNEFKTVRPIRITPVANITYIEDDVKRATSMIAHSPILILNQTPKLGQLVDYPNRKSREQEPRYKEVVKRIHLYKEIT